MLPKILNFNFNEQQKGRGLQILMPKQMLQGLPISLAQVKAGNDLKTNRMKSPHHIFFVLS